MWTRQCNEMPTIAVYGRIKCTSPTRDIQRHSTHNNKNDIYLDKMYYNVLLVAVRASEHRETSKSFVNMLNVCLLVTKANEATTFSIT